MKRFLTCVLSLVVCLSLLAACGEKQNSTAPSALETPTMVETPPTVPPEVPSSDETETDQTPSGNAISAEALAEYEEWFAQMEYNGLLRFPYTDGSDPAQIAPYLDLLFYDMGDTDITDEEYALLEKAGMFLEIDEFRLTRSFVTEYLVNTLDMLPEQTERMLMETEDLFGIYLSETDAWYMCHGDTAWMPYSFDQGVYLPNSETVKLYYTNPFLTVVLSDGEVDFLTDQPMVVTILIEGGERRVLSNEILSTTW